MKYSSSTLGSAKQNIGKHAKEASKILERGVFLIGTYQGPPNPYQNLPKVSKSGFISSGSTMQPLHDGSYKIKLPLQHPSQRRNILMTTHCRYEDTFETSEKKDSSNFPGTHPYYHVQSKFDTNQLDSERVLETKAPISQPLSIIKQSLNNLKKEPKNVS